MIIPSSLSSSPAVSTEVPKISRENKKNQIRLREKCGSWVYLSYSIIMLHLASRAKVQRAAREGMVTFSLSLVPAELAHKFLAINALSLWYLRYSNTKNKSNVRSSSNGFFGWINSIAAVIQGVAIYQFWRIYQDNITAKLTIRENLRDSDIPSYRIQTIGNLNWKKWATILLPLPQRTALSLSFPGIQRVRTLTYAHVGRQKLTKLKMDVFKHTNTASNAPIFLYIHGGGWITGHRRTPPFPLVYQVASHGWVVCVIDYRLSPKVRFPTHLKDCKRAIVWLKLHAKIQLDANGDFIVVGGESAGGHLSSLIALTANHKEFQPGFEDIDTSVRGCIDAYGVHDMTDRHGIYFARDENYHFTKFIEMFLMQKKIKGAEEEFEIASPISYLDPKCPPCDSDSPSTKKQKTKKMVPPFLIAHGTSDTLVLFQDSSFFYQELLQYRERHGQHQVKDIFLPIHDAHHAFNYLISPRTIAFGDAICTFMDNLHDKTKHLTIDEIAAAMIQNRSSATFSSLAVVQKQIVPSKL